MIKDLQTKVTEEGHMEATTYDKFACFCKSKTDEKVEAISEGETDADALTTKIQDLQAKRAQLDQRGGDGRGRPHDEDPGPPGQEGAARSRHPGAQRGDRWVRGGDRGGEEDARRGGCDVRRGPYRHGEGHFCVGARD